VYIGKPMHHISPKLVRSIEPKEPTRKSTEYSYKKKPKVEKSDPTHKIPQQSRRKKPGRYA
jgi:hypothetical protein